jgi:acyl carrier protein
MELSEPLQVDVFAEGDSGADRLQRTLAVVLEVSAGDLIDEASPDSITSWDSLNHLNLVMAIEGEFEISLSADEVIEMGNVGLIRAILRRHGITG